MNDENLIGSYLREFAECADEWFENATFLEERFYFFENFFKIDNLKSLEWPDIQELGDNLHCFATNAMAKKRAFGEPNHSIEYYRESLLYLAHGSDSPRKRIDSLSDKKGEHRLKFISKSAISELIGYIMPGKYTFFNSRSRKALELLGVRVESKRKETLGDQFENFSKAIEPINNEYQKIVGKKTKLPLSFEIDQFLSYLAENYDLEEDEDELDSEINEDSKINNESDSFLESRSLNKVYYGPPGTGKTFKVIEESLQIVLHEEEKKQLDWNVRSKVVSKFNEMRTKGYIEMVTFHQSYSYEEFVEGIRPDVSDDLLPKIRTLDKARRPVS